MKNQRHQWIFLSSFLIASIAFSNEPKSQKTVSFQLSQGFLTRLFHQEINETRPINEYTATGQVSGTAWTKGVVNLVPKMNTQWAEGLLDATGNVNTSTYVYQQQATAYVTANTSFRSAKTIGFDHRGFLVTPAMTNAATASHIHWIQVNSLFPGIAEKIAWKKALEQKPQAEYEMSLRVSQGINQNLDTRVNRPLAALNKQWNALLKGMKEMHLKVPSIKGMSAKEGWEVGAFAPVEAQGPGFASQGEDLSFQASAKGVEWTLSGLSGKMIQQANGAKIYFPETQPVALTFEKGQVTVEAHIEKVTVLEVDVPGRKVIFTYALSTDQGALILERVGKILVLPEHLKSEEGMTEEDKIIAEWYRDRLDPLLPVEAVLDPNAEKLFAEMGKAKFESVESSKGWLKIGLKVQ